MHVEQTRLLQYIGKDRIKYSKKFYDLFQSNSGYSCSRALLIFSLSILNCFKAIVCGKYQSCYDCHNNYFNAIFVYNFYFKVRILIKLQSSKCHEQLVTQCLKSHLIAAVTIHTGKLLRHTKGVSYKKLGYVLPNMYYSRVNVRARKIINK